jgi:sterol desaturase/sphingolipid hydroxylase (fatty acid hydroxylase superfamily)
VLSPIFSAALSGQQGLLSLFDIPLWLRVAIGLILLDGLVYAAHFALHRVPILWRLHQVHHSDNEMNASTHFRQHPLQLLLVSFVQLPFLYLLGIPGVSWVLLLPLGLAVQLWQHIRGNPQSALDRALVWVLATPSHHLVHHHPERRWHDSNYGVVFSFWDRWFGTHVPLATMQKATFANEHSVVPIGLADWPARTATGIASVLIMPFVHPPGAIAAQASSGQSAKKSIQSRGSKRRAKQ